MKKLIASFLFWAVLLILATCRAKLCHGQVTAIGTYEECTGPICLPFAKRDSLQTIATNIGRSNPNKGPAGTFFLTCAHGHYGEIDGHVLSDVHYVILGGKRYAIRMLAHIDESSGRNYAAIDLGLFFLYDQGLHPSVIRSLSDARNIYRISPETPEVGSVVYRVSSAPQNVTSFQAVKGKLLDENSINISSVSGDSGKPILNEDDQIVGIVWGGLENERGDITAHRHIVSFVTQIAGGIPDPRAGQVAGQAESGKQELRKSETSKVDDATEQQEKLNKLSEEMKSFRDDAEQRHSKLSDRLSDLHTVIITMKAFTGETARATAGAGATASGASGVIAWLATAAGLSATAATGVGIAVPVVWWLYSRRKKRKQQACRHPDPQVVKEPFPITVENPPPPQETITETRFAAYEKSTYSDAVSWAQAEMARKYPGVVSTLETLNSLVEQYLSSKPSSKPPSKKEPVNVR